MNNNRSGKRVSKALLRCLGTRPIKRTSVCGRRIRTTLARRRCDLLRTLYPTHRLPKETRPLRRALRLFMNRTLVFCWWVLCRGAYLLLQRECCFASYLCWGNVYRFDMCLGPAIEHEINLGRNSSSSFLGLLEGPFGLQSSVLVPHVRLPPAPEWATIFLLG